MPAERRPSAAALRCAAMSDAGPDLYCVYLGGDPAQGRMGEDHEVVFVVAEDLKTARRGGAGKWTGADDRPHVDMVQLLDVVDGYEVSLRPTDRAASGLIDLTYEPSDDD